MTEIILFPDVERLVRDVLLIAIANHPELPQMQVGTSIPNPRPAGFVRLLRTGGPRETLISEQAFVTVEAWADREVDAVQMLSFCRAVLNAQDGEAGLFGVVELAGPTNLPDPTTSQTRYTQSFGIRTQGTPALL